MPALADMERNGLAPFVLSTEKLRAAMLWLMAFAGAFVFIEPSPYEVLGVVTIIVFALTGLVIPVSVTPLVLILILLNVGYGMAVAAVIDRPKTLVWVLVSVFLAVTCVLYAAVLAHNTQTRLKWLMRGYTAAAVLASLVAIGAYFRLFGSRSDMFLLYDRGRGTFNDPNVLGAFLILPALLLLQRMLTGRLSDLVHGGAMLLVVIGGLFLSFSRAAWGQFAFCSILMMALMFVTTRSSAERTRIVTLGIAAIVGLTLFIVALLSVDRVAELFQSRAALEQSYDAGRFGRFGRYILGAELALEQPLGIGPLQFSRYFPEDPHNTFLNSFMSGGWLGGLAYLTLTLVTIVNGFRFVVVATPWRPTYLAVYAAYIGTAAESAIIDIDHWRHYFLILGVLWGLMAASQSYRRDRTAAASPLPAV
jgi:hypothetical protein